MTQKKVVLTSILMISIVIIVVALLYVNTQSQSNQEEIELVTIGAEFSKVNTLLFIAQHQDHFKENGLNVTIEPYSSGAAALNGMLNGEVDIAMASEFAFVTKLLDNASISIFGSIDRFQQIYVVARIYSGIQNIPDLANKTVGYTFGSAAEFYLGRFLELNNMNISQINRINMQPNNIVDALANESIDAAVVWQPFVSQIENRMGDEVVIWPAQGGQQIYCTAVAENSWIRTHEETVVKFLEALAQAEDHLFNYLAEAKDIISKSLNQSAEYIDSTWSNHQFTLSLDQSLVLIMEDEARWLIAFNLTPATQVPNFQNYIYIEGLTQVKPNSVTIMG